MNKRIRNAKISSTPKAVRPERRTFSLWVLTIAVVAALVYVPVDVWKDVGNGIVGEAIAAAEPEVVEPPVLKAFQVQMDIPSGAILPEAHLVQMCNALESREWTTASYEYVVGQDVNALNSLWSERAHGSLTFWVTAPEGQQAEIEQILLEFGNL